MFDLGYKDAVDPIDGLSATARYLAENPLEPGGSAERSLSDIFNYEGEDRLIEAWREAMGHVGVVAGEVDAGLTDRYSATYDDSKRTGWTTIRR